MHLKYYGTSGGGEGIPGMFCTCPICENARRVRGREIRTRSQALVDGKLLIDFPPDTFLHTVHDDLDLPAITALLVTHSHEDHLYPSDFENRKPFFAHVGELGVFHSEPLRIYASALAMRAVRAADCDKLEERRVIDLHEVEYFKSFRVDDFIVTALAADHAPDTGPALWIVERGGKAMLYGNDTGYFPEETWEYLARAKPQFDFVSLDCTSSGKGSDHRRGHMSLAVNCEVRDRMVELGCAGEHTMFCAHHISHNGGLTHAELTAKAAKCGFHASYDGMKISF